MGRFRCRNGLPPQTFQMDAKKEKKEEKKGSGAFSVSDARLQSRKGQPKD